MCCADSTVPAKRKADWREVEIANHSELPKVLEGPATGQSYGWAKNGDFRFVDPQDISAAPNRFIPPTLTV